MIEHKTPIDVRADTACFKAWWDYHGLLIDVEERNPANGAPMRTRLYAFETLSASSATHGQVPEGGAVFGFIAEGRARICWPGKTEWYGDLGGGQWFALPDGVELQLAPNSRAMVVQSVGFLGLAAMGGPIEPAGRLRYIDLCSDTLLMCPPLLGDPCLNHLHFPPGISQTEHFHPSGRFGIVASGQGLCETPLGRSALRSGVVFYIPNGAHHRFVTEAEMMNVIAFHPDSDWGPSDQNHPMINRTWVDGRKMDNSTSLHQGADVIGRSS